MSVPAAAAGDKVFCQCGAAVVVPKLSELRRSAGKGAYETSTVDAIAAMLRDGPLPWGNVCAHSEFPTEDVFDVSVQCESCYSQDRGGGWVAVLAGALAGGMVRQELETHGRELVVYTPIRLCEKFHARFRKAGQRRLRRLLRTVSVYGRLLDEYPYAQILPGYCPGRQNAE
ncbi:MAG: hypothetical protein ABIP48_16520 [Planctomycetota bacterium]